MDMARIRKPINLTLPPDLIRQFDQWREAQLDPPSRTQVIERLLREMLAKDEGDQK